jgi:hypothetical protein
MVFIFDRAQVAGLVLTVVGTAILLLFSAGWPVILAFVTGAVVGSVRLL